MPLGFSKKHGSISLSFPDVLFLEPGFNDDPSPLHGSLRLTLKKPCRLSSVRVSLLGVTQAFSDDHHGTLTEHLSQSIALFQTSEEGVGSRPEAPHEPHDVGDYASAFVFEVPGNSAPSLALPSGGHVRYVVRAEAHGVGVGRVDIVEEQEVQLVSIQHRDEAPEPLDMLIEDYMEDLGHITLGAWSPMAAVGGFISSDASARGRPEDTRLINSELLIKQTIEVKLGNEKTKPEEREFCLYKVDHAELLKSWSSTSSGHPLSGPGNAKLHVGVGPTGGKALSFMTKGVPASVDVYRLRWHGELKPTTLEFTKTPFQISHELVFRHTWIRGAGTKGKQASFSRKISIASCASRLGSLVLPKYGQEQKPGRKEVHCICGLSIDEIAAEQKSFFSLHARRMEQYNMGVAPHPALGAVHRAPLPPKPDNHAPSSSASSVHTRASSEDVHSIAASSYR